MILLKAQNVYVRNEKAISDAMAFSTTKGPSGLFPLRHNPSSREVTIITRDHLVKKYADTFYQSEYNGAYGYTHDLFGNPLPHAGGRIGVVKNAHDTSGEVVPNASQQSLQDTQAPDAEYYVNTIVGTEFNKKLGASYIKSSLHLAQATHYLNESPVERFDGIVTNQDGTPLASARKYPSAKDYDSIARTLLSNAQSDKGDELSIVIVLIKSMMAITISLSRSMATILVRRF